MHSNTQDPGTAEERAVVVLIKSNLKSDPGSVPFTIRSPCTNRIRTCNHDTQCQGLTHLLLAATFFQEHWGQLVDEKICHVLRPRR
jgi:hypothetical protein